MALISIAILMEAGTFTAGCALLECQQLDVEQAGIVLTALIAGLVFALLVILTPDTIRDAVGLDPAETYWSAQGALGGSAP